MPTDKSKKVMHTDPVEQRSWMQSMKEGFRRGMEQDMAPNRVNIQRDPNTGEVIGLTQPMMKPDIPKSYGTMPKAQRTELHMTNMHDGVEEVGSDEKERAQLSKERGAAAAKLPQEKKAGYVSEQGKLEAQRGGMSALEKSRLQSENVAVQMSGGKQGAEKYHNGKDSVMGKNDVPAILEKGERVLSKKDNKKLKGMSNMKLVEAALAHKKKEAKEPAKEEKKETLKQEKKEVKKDLKEIRIRRGAGNKGYIAEHHYKGNEGEPIPEKEEHVLSNHKELAKHVKEHMGDIEAPEGMTPGQMDPMGAQEMHAGMSDVKSIL